MANKKRSTRLAGHELLFEGAAFNEQGKLTTTSYGFTSTGGTGRARCKCGATSPVLHSGNHRKQWHRQHKAEILKQQGQHDDPPR